MKIVLAILAVVILSNKSVAVEASGMKGSVQSSIEVSKKQKSVSPLFSESFKVMGIGLSKGQKLEKHQTPVPAFLFVHSGSVNFSMSGKVVELRAGDYFSIPAKEMHEVEATDDSRLLLIK